MIRRHLVRAARQRARGQAMTWFVGAVVLVILSLGLTADGMLLFAAHRRATLLAESAARAGASQLDLTGARAPTGGAPTIDPDLAEATARAYVLRQQPEAEVDARANLNTIVVTVQ